MVWSRTYLQVHWLSDAVAGATLGVGVALLTVAAVQIVSTPPGHANGCAETGPRSR
jgi:membrane-associated phospholipid phosphatase